MEVVLDTALVDRYQKRFRSNFARSTVKRVRTITGMNLTARDYEIRWDVTNGVWGYFDYPHDQTRHWNAFGIDDPDGKKSVVNSVQINPSRSGMHNTGGAFLYDGASDTVYIAHAGKLRGKDASQFRSMFETISVKVEKKERSFVVIAELEDPALNRLVAEFVIKCAAFKAGEAVHVPSPRHAPFDGDEYDGEIRYHRRGYVAGRRTHGIVHKQLRRELERLGISNPQRDVNRDLFAQHEGRSMLFEIKTGSDTSSIYAAVGQLMMHGRAANRAQCILVAPPLRSGDGEKLKRLEIDVLEYDLAGTVATFVGLKQLVNA